MLTNQIPESLKEDFLNRGFTRRHLGRLATVMSAASTLHFYGESALAWNQLPAATLHLVRIGANENPMGPCGEAVAAVENITRDCGYYLGETGVSLRRTFAQQAGLKPTYVHAFPGSSDPLFRTAAAYTSPKRGLVIADPSFEAPGRVAEYFGAKVTGVPLREDHSHDVRAMLGADPSAGLFYVCNPNNPTGTLTSHEDIEHLVDNKPDGAIVLVDEAYIHFTEAASCLDLVRSDKDIIVLRTFSKIYGMAGLRCGLAVGRPDLLGKIRNYGTGFLPATGMVAAEASLKAEGVVPRRKQAFREIRENVYEFLDKHRIEYIQGLANFFMMDVKRDARQVARAMRAENVMIGRTWPIRPTYARVSIGTKSEMETFKTALLKVMS